MLMSFSFFLFGFPHQIGASYDVTTGSIQLKFGTNKGTPGPWNEFVWDSSKLCIATARCKIAGSPAAMKLPSRASVVALLAGLGVSSSWMCWFWSTKLTFISVIEDCDRCKWGIFGVHLEVISLACNVWIFVLSSVMRTMGVVSTSIICVKNAQIKRHRFCNLMKMRYFT